MSPCKTIFLMTFQLDNTYIVYIDGSIPKGHQILQDPLSSLRPLVRVLAPYGLAYSPYKPSKIGTTSLGLLIIKAQPINTPLTFIRLYSLPFLGQEAPAKLLS